MPIQEENIVFVESQVMDDVPEGGGAATGRVVPDCQLNNVFEDISDLDRAYGRFNLRKLFLAVRSLDTDLYGGAKLAMTALPTDPALDYALFTTKDPFDTRDSASSRVSAYLIKSGMWHGALWENHIIGMTTITLIQRVDAEIPRIGKTLCIVQNEGLTTEREQYVRVIDATSVVRTFTDEKGDYERALVTLTLSDSLRFDFTGHTPNRYDQYDYTIGARVRDTSIADASRYHGARRLRTAAAVGDTQVRASSLFAQLVPSSQIEIALPDQPFADGIEMTLDAGGGHSVTVSRIAHTRARGVTPETRRFNWIETLSPRPAPGSVRVAYMAQGNWYELIDQGDGTLAGADSSFGAGTISAETGTVSVTLGALPDSGSAVIWSWDTPEDLVILAGQDQDTDPRGAYLEVAIPEDKRPVVRGSVTISYVYDGQTLSLTQDTGDTFTGADGVEGYLSHDDRILLWTQHLPDPGTTVSVSWSYRIPVDPTNDPVSIEVSGFIAQDGTLDLGTAIDAGGLSMEVLFESESLSSWVTVIDDGQGNLVIEQDPRYSGEGTVVGTINYQTGVCVFNNGYDHTRIQFTSNYYLL